MLIGLIFACSVHAQSKPSRRDIADQAFAKLGLVDGSVADVLPVATASGGLQMVIPIDGEPQTIQLTPVSVRSPIYNVLIQKPDGSYEQVEATPERNYRGSIIGMADSVVAATYDEAGFRGKIQLADGTRLWVEPLASRIAAASPEQHIVYRDQDLIGHQDSCPEPVNAHDHGDSEDNAGAVAGASPGLYVAEIAIDADFEYYLAHDSSTTAVQNQINTVINAMNLEYERDVQIRHVITTIIVRTSESDPYTFTDSDSLLNQFRSHWNNFQTGIHRDAAQLFTGRDVDSNVIGIAYLGEICTSSSYSVVQSDFSGSDALAYQTDLSAHELGHNWGASHCSCENPPYTMNPFITGANVFSPTASIPPIKAYRNTRGCLDVGDELLRITLGVPTTPLEIGQAVQLSATADFRYGPDQLVTSQTSWSVDRPDLVDVSPTGLLFVLNAEAESCVTIYASFTSEGITKSSQKQITVKDPSLSLGLVAGNPPVNAIDARRPSDADGSNPKGWSTFDLTLNGEPCSMNPSRFTVTQVGGSQPAPVVMTVTSLGGAVVRLTLNKAVEPGAWTTIDDTLSDVSLRIGFLPGDVNSDGMATPSDILALIDALNGLSTLAIWSSDLDRSEVPAPADILTLIDLLNGAGGFSAWNGVSLPDN